MRPTKHRRLNYHKLKQFIRTKSKCSDVRNNDNIFCHNHVLENQQSSSRIGNSGKQLEMIEEIIDVDNYKFKLQCILPENIDIVSKNQYSLYLHMSKT